MGDTSICPTRGPISPTGDQQPDAQIRRYVAKRMTLVKFSMPEVLRKFWNFWPKFENLGVVNEEKLKNLGFLHEKLENLGSSLKNLHALPMSKIKQVVRVTKGRWADILCHVRLKLPNQIGKFP